MSSKLRWLVGLAVFAAAGGMFVPRRPPPEPFDGRACTVNSVMLLHREQTSSFVLDAPFRVVRDGRITLSRPDESWTRPVVRVDLTIDGESVILFSRIRE